MSDGIMVLILIVIAVIWGVSWLISKFKRDKPKPKPGLSGIRMCGSCKSRLPDYCSVGDRCPHCGAQFKSATFIVVE